MSDLPAEGSGGARDTLERTYLRVVLWARRHYGWISKMPGTISSDDLVHDVFLAIASGSRSWPAEFPLEVVAKRDVKTDVMALYRKWRAREDRGIRLVSIDGPGSNHGPAAHEAPGGDSARRSANADLDPDAPERARPDPLLRAAIIDLVRGDDDAETAVIHMLDAIDQGAPPPRPRDLVVELGWELERVRNVVKRIRRRLGPARLFLRPGDSTEEGMTP